jgi:hypothetical protein
LFKGDFVGGKPKEGILKYENGEEYTGPLNDQRLRDGYGIYKYKNGETYCGDFLNGLKEGKGIFKKLNGDSISGVWKDDFLTMGQ